MERYAESLTEYKRLATLEVKVGDLLLGNFHPIRIQTMTTTDTMNTKATVEQSIRCIEAGAELVRITAPSKNEAENLLNIKNELRKHGYTTPLVADIHFTPNAAEIAARVVDKVRVNPGNYVDKKKFELIEYSDADYQEEIERIRNRFTPLVKICKEYGTAMRIGTNHGSLSDRIMSRYGDTPIGMVESAMEFLRIAESENYYNIVLSMKSSNPQVMVQAYRLLIENMYNELGHCYPLHLGVTEAGDGEDGRIKSAIGIGTLLEDGIGDTIRVSLTEDPEFEIPVCRNIVKRYVGLKSTSIPPIEKSSLSILNANTKHTSFEIQNISGKHVPVVIADFSKKNTITPGDLEDIGYKYDVPTDKWNISDMAADYIFCANKNIDFALPGTLRIINYYDAWKQTIDKEKYVPIFDEQQYLDDTSIKSQSINFVMLDCYSNDYSFFNKKLYFEKIKHDTTAVLCLSSSNKNAMQSIRRMYIELIENNIRNPVIFICDSNDDTMDESLIHYAIETGALFLDGFGSGIWLSYNYSDKNKMPGYKIMNSIAFGILQATRMRISKTEYISCPSCGRTLFDLQETTAKIRAVTNHLKGVKIAIMGCIVNGPGEMADADFGYVGSGPGKITLYRGKEVIKRSVPEDIAVEELINLLKESEAWVEPALIIA
ncbi:(E)-4-hydroxy-3-methylbut-2-enyl-diphosphate synthase [Ginsengibacter hankyongi]|uniref:4-hydroxy-3-methylbut-2-en-1-yl diphosphate synthase (flavodoxin) n=1 Tax=Ginsengibacter hankyongi TaxID=2607284 RepID=A0A5J5IHR2_9BACT|nr:(E)-4-hydroxy-3-methylbut-2-enyl-diphosphate synthase [Ginsengibacter hankyongi]KAA9039571.1 (E)-4-hydroxy-3-methylbut-2-enyl-diphosphate synthase [Ginsengibacter hankyongi]